MALDGIMARIFYAGTPSFGWHRRPPVLRSLGEGGACPGQRLAGRNRSMRQEYHGGAALVAQSGHPIPAGPVCRNAIRQASRQSTQINLIVPFSSWIEAPGKNPTECLK